MKAPHVAHLGFALVLVPLVLGLSGLDDDDDGKDGFDSIDEKDYRALIVTLASPEFEGRDAPSKGLERAARYIESAVKEHGLVGGAKDGSFRHAFSQRYTVPIENRCSLEFRREEDASAEALVQNEEFVALGKCQGEATGELVFLGFGITKSSERWDDLKGPKVDGKIAMFFHGEPRHKRLFEGPDEVTEDADVFGKLANLVERGIAGAIVIRRALPEPTKGADGEPLAPAEFGYRYAWAQWNVKRPFRRHPRDLSIPVVEVTEAAASRLLGEDVAKLATKMDKSGKPVRVTPKELVVSLSTAFEEADVSMDNVVAKLEGSDPELKDEYVMLGAHYDHIGVGTDGRIGTGADDNGTGTTALIEIAEAMSIAKPRRSILFCWFAAEEDGLVGSEFLSKEMPVPVESVNAMLNMDMLGYGDDDYMIAVGTQANPAFEKVVKRAMKLHSTKIKDVDTEKGMDLFERSDHYHFHKIGIPAIFFSEWAEIDSKHPNYHNYGDTVENIDIEKALRCTRMIYNAAWIVANDDERLPPPR